MSVPIQNASVILIAVKNQQVVRQIININIPHPRIPAIVMAPTIPQGTAVAALEASSLMCTLESNEPEDSMIISC